MPRRLKLAARRGRKCVQLLAASFFIEKRHGSWRAARCLLMRMLRG
jgi:hypothetical protein